MTIEEPNPVHVELESQYRLQQVTLARHRGEAEALTSQISQLAEEVAALQAELPQVEFEEQALAAEVSMLEQTALLFLEKTAETQILQSIDLAGTSVILISPPGTPGSPIRPRKTFNMAIAGMLGLMLSVMLAFLLNAFDSTVKDPADIEQLIGVPVIGYVPNFAKLKGAN